MAKDNQIKWILGAVVVGGVLYFILKKPEVAVARAPAVGVPGMPIAPSVAEPTTCRERAIQLAVQQLGLPESELTIRSLIPQDLGLTTWSLNLAAVGWNNGVINTNIADNRFCCITGVSYSGSACEQIRIRVGASTVAQFSIQQVPMITTTHHIDISPVLAQQNLPISVDAYASAISATDEVIFSGVTIERAGMLLA